MRLKGKIALITGSTSGLGAVMAARFAAEGARVVVSGRNTAKGEQIAGTIRQTGGDAFFCRADITQESEIQGLITCTQERYGALDVLVNNAGPVDLLASGVDKPLHLMSTDDLEAMLKSGIFGALWCCKYAIAEMMRGQGGAIVNISSHAAVIGLPSLPGYSVAKGGLSALTRQLAVDYAEANIRVNAIVAGFIVHETTEKIIASPERAAEYRSRQLVSQFGRPDDVANAAIYLASDDSVFVTGTSLVVDGGSLAMSRRAPPIGTANTPYSIGKSKT